MINIELGADYGCEPEKLDRAIKTMRASGWSDENINAYLVRIAKRRAAIKALTEQLKEQREEDEF